MVVDSVDTSVSCLFDIALIFNIETKSKQRVSQNMKHSEIKMLRNVVFRLNRKIKMPRNSAIAKKNPAKLKYR